MRMLVAEYEKSLLEFLISALYARAGEPGTLRGEGKTSRFDLKKPMGGGECAAAVPLEFATPPGRKLTHAVDVLVTTARGKLLALDLKWAENDLDAVKARAFDMILLKKALGGKLWSMMIYLRPTGAASADEARDICYPYDEFFAIDHQDPQNPAVWVPVLDRIEAEVKSRS